MSGPYFESGYIDINYFEGDGVTQSTDATLTSAVSVTVSGSITRGGDSTLTVSTTHSTDAQRNRFAEVSITDAFNATVSVSISKNLFSTLNSQFDWSVTASKIASNQSTLDSIITLSLQGDRSRALAATTLSSSFTLTTQIQRILTAQSTQNTAFTVTAQIDKILNAQSDQSSAFTVTAQIDKILNAQSAVTATSTITATVEKLLSGASTQNLNSTLTVMVSKIISGNVNITDAFTSTLTVSVTKNHTADLNSAFSISVQAIKIGSNIISLNSEFNITITADKIGGNVIAVNSNFGISVVSDKIRNTSITINSDSSLNGVISRIRPLDSALISESAVQVSVNRIQQFTVVLSAVFTPTLNIIILRNHTASISSAFGIECTVSVTRTVAATFNSTTTLSVTAQKIKLATITLNAIAQLGRLDNTGSRIAKTITANGNAKVSTAHSQFGGASALFDGTGDYLSVASNTDFAFGTAAFTIEMWVYRTVSGVTHILLDQRVANPTNYAPVVFINASNILQYNNGAASVITGATTVPLNAWSHIAVSRSGTSTRLFLNGVQEGSTYTDTRNYIQTPVIIGSRFDGATGNFSGYIDEFRITKGLARYTATFTPSATAFTNDANTVLLIHANGDNNTTVFTDDVQGGFVENAQASRTASAQANIQDAFVSTMTVSISRDNTITATVTVTQSTTVNKIVGVISTISTASTVDVTGARIRFFDIDLTAVSTLNNVPVNRTASAQANIQDAFVSTMSVSTVIGTTVNLTSTTEFTVVGTRVRLLNQGIGAEFTVSTQATRIRSLQVDLTGAFNSTLTITLLPGTNITLSSAVSLTATVGKLFRTGQILSAPGNVGFSPNGGLGIARTTGTYNNVSVTGGSGSGAVFNFTVNNTKFISVATPVNPGFNYTKLDTLTIPAGSLGPGSTATTFSVVVNDIALTSSFVLSAQAVETDSFGATFNITTTLTVDAQRFRSTTVNITADSNMAAQIDKIRPGSASLLCESTVTVTINRTGVAEINIGSTATLAVTYTRVRLLNQGIGAEFALSVVVGKVKQFNISLEGTFTPVLTVTVFRNHTATLNSAFNLSAQIIVVKLVQIAITTQTTLTVEALLVKVAQANVSGVFSLSLTQINATIAFNANSNQILAGVFTVAATVLKIKRVSATLQSQFSRVTNFGAVIESVITETDSSQYPGIGSGIAYFDGTDYIQLNNMPVIGTGDYTIEMLAHRSALMGDGSTFIEQDLFNADFNLGEYGVPQAGPYIYIGNDDEIKAGNTYILNGDQITTGAFKFQTDANLHVALVRHNAQTRLYVNGVQRGDTLADTVPWTSTEWFLGDLFLGYVDEFRVSTIARYTGGNFGDIYDRTGGFQSNSEFRKDSNTAVLLHFNNSLDEGLAQPEKTVNVNAALNTAFTVTAVLSNTRGVDIVAFAESVLSVDTSNVIDYQLVITVTAQSNITVSRIRNSASELFSNITTQVSVEKLKIINSAVAAQFNFAIDIVKLKNVQLNVGAECTAVIAVNVIRNSSVTVSDQFNLNVLGTRVRFGVINLQSQFVTTVVGTETEGFAEPVTMTVISTVTVSAESLRIIAVTPQMVSTAVVNVSVLRNAAATLLVNAGKLSAIVVQRYAEISLISQVTLNCAITKTTRYNAELNSTFANNTIIIRQRPGAAVMSTQSTMVVTAIKNISITKTLNAVFSITAQPQPLNQILTVVRMVSSSAVTVSGIIVYIEKYELYVREEQRLLNIVSEERNIYITEENRVFTITDVEE